jgi:hypothetical protein
MGSAQGKPTAPAGMSPAAVAAVGQPAGGGAGSAEWKPAPCSAMREAAAASGDPLDGACPVPEEYRG